MLKEFFKMDNSLFRRISVRGRIIYVFGIIAGIMGGSILILSIENLLRANTEQQCDLLSSNLL